MDSQVWAAPRLIQIVISIPGGQTVELDPAFLGRPVGWWASWGRLPSQPVESWRGVWHTTAVNLKSHSEGVKISHVTLLFQILGPPQLPAMRALVCWSTRIWKCPDYARQKNSARHHFIPVISSSRASAQFSHFVVLRKIFIRGHQAQVFFQVNDRPENSGPIASINNLQLKVASVGDSLKIK